MTTKTKTKTKTKTSTSTSTSTSTISSTGTKVRSGPCGSYYSRASAFASALAVLLLLWIQVLAIIIFWDGDVLTRMTTTATTTHATATGGVFDGSDEYDEYDEYWNLHRGLVATCGSGDTPASLVSLAASSHLEETLLLPLVRAYVDLARERRRNSGGNDAGDDVDDDIDNDEIRSLLELQACRYASLDRWTRLVSELAAEAETKSGAGKRPPKLESRQEPGKRSVRWAAHGWTAVGAACRGSMNPWDADVSVATSDCALHLGRLWDSLVVNGVRGTGGGDGNGTGTGTGTGNNNGGGTSTNGWQIRHLDEEWMLMLKPRDSGGGEAGLQYHYKLVSVHEKPILRNGKGGADPVVGGMDIICLDDDDDDDSHVAPLPPSEILTMNLSGFASCIRGYDTFYETDTDKDFLLRTIPFGPTTINVVPDHVLASYVRHKYDMNDYCAYPLSDGTAIHPPTFLPKMTIRDNAQDANNAHGSNVSIMKEGDVRHEQFVHPSHFHRFEHALSHWYFPRRMRKEWLGMVGKVRGDALTKFVFRNLDHVEIDNSIAPMGACTFMDDEYDTDTRKDGGGTKERRRQSPTIKVVNFNAERGTTWYEFAHMVHETPELKHADAVILNEMDIGMARSGNIHTTRALAHALGMNYAYGVEFLELTRGTREEQEMTVGHYDSLSLHGNAILSHCELYDPMVVRDGLDNLYFSTRPHFANANGYEKRLGGRMGIFVRVRRPESRDSGKGKKQAQTPKMRPHIVLGSIHKIHPTAHARALGQYLGRDAAGGVVVGSNDTQEEPYWRRIGAVVAGDFSRTVCAGIGLRNLDDAKKHATWPANCAIGTTGRERGDNFCGDLDVKRGDAVTLPCYYDSLANKTVQLSDHSIISIDLKLREWRVIRG